MEHNKLSETQQTVIARLSTPGAGNGENKISFTPSPDEVARRAYFAYENERSQPGHDVQHWLKAEADLIAERNLTRVHGFHNQT
jgi:hypothetical protein